MEIVNDFKDWLQHANRYSKGTSDVYLASVRHFLRNYSEFYNKEFTELDKGDLNIYYLKLMIDNVPVRTINSRMTALKKFNQFLVEKGFQKEIVIDSSYRIEYDNLPVEKQSVDTYDLKKFLAAVKEAGTKRDLAIVLLIMKTQMQVQEIIELKFSDYQEGVITRKTKDNKELDYYIDSELKSTIEDYLIERKGQLFANSEYLFITHKSGQIDKRQIYHLFKTYSHYANLLSPITPRKLSEIEVNKKSIVKEKEPSYEFHFGKSFKMNIDVVTNNFDLKGFEKVKVVLLFQGAQKVFYFGLVKPEWIQSLFLNRRAFVPRGLIIVKSVRKELIYQTILKTFYTSNNEEVQFLNTLEGYALSENDIFELEEMY